MYVYVYMYTYIYVCLPVNVDSGHHGCFYVHIKNNKNSVVYINKREFIMKNSRRSNLFSFL